MNWDYIAGFFDGEGNINVSKTCDYKKGGHNLVIMIRIYQSSKEVLEEIKAFIGYGSIYCKKSNLVFELTFSKKENVSAFLSNIKDKVILKKEQVNYLLNNYSFNRGNNPSFDVDKFRSFITRKNVVRKLHS